MNYSVPVCQIEFLIILPLCTSLSRDHEHSILDRENHTNLNCFENIEVLLKWLIHIHSSDILSYLWKVDFNSFTTGLKHTHLNKSKLLFIIIMQRRFFFSLCPLGVVRRPWLQFLLRSDKYSAKIKSNHASIFILFLHLYIQAFYSTYFLSKQHCN